MKKLGIALLAGSLSLPFAFAAQGKPATDQHQPTDTAKTHKKKAGKRSSKRKNKTTTTNSAQPTAK